MALSGIRTGDMPVNVALAPQRLAAAMLSSFGLLAIILASVGVYSVMAYSVLHRTREKGIRMAIGAGPEAIVREILGRALALSAAGLVLGGAGSVAAAHYIAVQLKDVSPYDGLTFALVTLLLAGISGIVALAPALVAARTDPLNALKRE